MGHVCQGATNPPATATKCVLVPVGGSGSRAPRRHPHPKLTDRMEQLSTSDITILFLGFALMLGMGRVFGEFFTLLKQPSIVGELMAGIILGPTLLGALFPDLFAHIFPATGPVAIGYQTVINLGVVMLLMVAGLEIDLGVVLRQGRAAILISVFGSVVPFAMGAIPAYLAPVSMGMAPGNDPLIYALFLGIALSISALPVIAKIMLDLKLFKTDVGLLVMGAAMLNDLVGWLGFAIVLSMLESMATTDTGGISIWGTIGLTLLVFGLSLTAGRWVIHRILPLIQARFSWPGGIISFTLVLTLFGAALTEAIGIHAVFGAFLAGIIVGDSAHLREQTRTILNQFVTYVFAPFFLVAIGLQADFVGSFDLRLVLLILTLAFVGKFAGCMLGAYLARLPTRTGLAVSFGMNARGAMEIILALLALQYGIIQNEVFVALVLLAVLSSLVSGPLMNVFITTPREWLLEDLLDNGNTFVPAMEASTREAAIAELSAKAAATTGLDEAVVRRAVSRREYLMGTLMDHEIATPRARFQELERPVLVVGRSLSGVDWGGSGTARLVFLLLTPGQDMVAQSELLEQIEQLFAKREMRDAIYENDSVDVVRALIKTGSAPVPSTL